MRHIGLLTTEMKSKCMARIHIKILEEFLDSDEQLRHYADMRITLGMV